MRLAVAVNLPLPPLEELDVWTLGKPKRRYV